MRQLIVLSLLLAAALPAAARETIVTGANGRTWSRTVNHYDNGGGNLGRSTSTTRPNGKTATTDFNRSVANGTITDTRSVTGFNGATGTATLTRTPGEGGTLTRSFTPPN